MKLELFNIDSNFRHSALNPVALTRTRAAAAVLQSMQQTWGAAAPRRNGTGLSAGAWEKSKRSRRRAAGGCAAFTRR